MVLLTLFFALKTDIVDFSADKIWGGNFQILGENFPPEMPRINTAFWTLKSGGDRPPHSKKWGGDRSPPSPPEITPMKSADPFDLWMIDINLLRS
jgi:hypothetical protein